MEVAVVVVVEVVTVVVVVVVGSGDQVVCFMCGIAMKNWTTADNPWCCHIKLSPDCGFPALALSETDLNAYKEIHLLSILYSCYLLL